LGLQYLNFTVGATVLHILKQPFLKAFLTALAFSSFIYFEYFGIEKNNFSLFLNSLVSLLAIYFIFKLDKKELTIFGFFVGIFWFYWISYSFRYYDLSYLMPVIILFFGFLYALFFYVIGFFDSIWVRYIAFLSLTYIEPFSFNWFKPQIIFINSYFGTSFIQFALIILILVIFIELQKKYNNKSYFILILLLFATNDFNFNLIKNNINYQENLFAEVKSLEIELAGTQVLQKDKWLDKYEIPIVKMNLNLIKKAINENKKIVVLPESTFPMYLNLYSDLMEHLKLLSQSITIWTGALYKNNGEIFNATYIFENGKYQIAKKTVLVPFGEYLPLPEFLTNWINKTFFDGAIDFSTAREPVDITINNTVFRHAICYEATSELLYRDSPKYLIAISNNGWFTPSIEPTLQRLLMQHFSNLNNTVIFHSANDEGTTIIYPEKNLLLNIFN
jgi:apolipoprotein N-acyltransferase